MMFDISRHTYGLGHTRYAEIQHTNIRPWLLVGSQSVSSVYQLVMLRPHMYLWTYCCIVASLTVILPRYTY